MELITFAIAMLLVGVILGGLLGWLAATHIHSVASAATRATTISSGDVAKLNSFAAGLGDKVQATLSGATQPAIAAAVTAAQPQA